MCRQNPDSVGLPTTCWKHYGMNGYGCGIVGPPGLSQVYLTALIEIILPPPPGLKLCILILPGPHHFWNQH